MEARLHNWRHGCHVGHGQLGVLVLVPLEVRTPPCTWCCRVMLDRRSFGLDCSHDRKGGVMDGKASERSCRVSMTDTAPTGLKRPSAVENTGPAHITTAGLDARNGVENTGPAHITTAGLDRPSAVENTGPAHITTAGLDSRGGVENTASAHITTAGLDARNGVDNSARL